MLFLYWIFNLVHDSDEHPFFVSILFFSPNRSWLLALVKLITVFAVCKSFYSPFYSPFFINRLDIDWIKTKVLIYFGFKSGFIVRILEFGIRDASMWSWSEQKVGTVFSWLINCVPCVDAVIDVHWNYFLYWWHFSIGDDTFVPLHWNPLVTTMACWQWCYLVVGKIDCFLIHKHQEL